MDERENTEKQNGGKVDPLQESSNADYLRGLLHTGSAEPSTYNAGNEIASAPISVPSGATSDTSNFALTDNKIPHRGKLWHIVFIGFLVIVTGVVIYTQDWFLLVFIVVFGGVILWRGNRGSEILLAISEKDVLLNDKEFSFEDIDNFYFSNIGDDPTITFKMIRMYYPRMTFFLSDANDVEKIRALLANNVPESETVDENYTDLIIRKLKL